MSAPAPSLVPLVKKPIRQTLVACRDSAASGAARRLPIRALRNVRRFLTGPAKSVGVQAGCDSAQNGNPQALHFVPLRIADAAVPVWQAPRVLRSRTSMAPAIVVERASLGQRRPTLYRSVAVSASACSSQYVMSISRYNVVAIGRCS